MNFLHNVYMFICTQKHSLLPQNKSKLIFCMGWLHPVRCCRNLLYPTPHFFNYQSIFRTEPKVKNKYGYCC